MKMFQIHRCQKALPSSCTAAQARRTRVFAIVHAQAPGAAGPVGERRKRVPVSPPVETEKSGFAAAQRLRCAVDPELLNFRRVKQADGPQNKKEAPTVSWCFFLEVPPRFELGVELLQSSALPLGYGTAWSRTAPKKWSE